MLIAFYFSFLSPTFYYITPCFFNITRFAPPVKERQVDFQGDSIYPITGEKYDTIEEWG